MENAVNVFWHGEVTSVSTIFKNCPNPHVWSPSALPTHQMTMKLSLRHSPGLEDTFTYLIWHVKMFSGFAAALWGKKSEIEKINFLKGSQEQKFSLSPKWVLFSEYSQMYTFGALVLSQSVEWLWNIYRNISPVAEILWHTWSGIWKWFSASKCRFEVKNWKLKIYFL